MHSKISKSVIFILSCSIFAAFKTLPPLGRSGDPPRLTASAAENISSGSLSLFAVLNCSIIFFKPFS
jgi:hypothetical protein